MISHLRQAHIQQVFSALSDYLERGGELHMSAQREDETAPVVLTFTIEDADDFHTILSERMSLTEAEAEPLAS